MNGPDEMRITVVPVTSVAAARDLMATIIAEHQPGPEGIVPAILAEELVEQLQERGVLLSLELDS